MGVGETSKFSSTDLEGLLKAALVPVEPDQQFIRRLKARLVRYEGEGISPIWAVAAGLGIATLLVVASMGVALRLLLALLTAIGGRQGRSERPAESSASLA